MASFDDVWRITGRFFAISRQKRETISTAWKDHDGPQRADHFRQGGRSQELLRGGAAAWHADLHRQPAGRRARGSARRAPVGPLDAKPAPDRFRDGSART